MGWLKETNLFSPSCPLDNQEFLPLTDFLLDDLINLECIEDTENTKFAGECAVKEDEFCIDLMDSTYAQHQKDVGPEMTDCLNKYKKRKYDECFPVTDCLSKNLLFEDQLQNASNFDDDLPCSSENAMPLSSVSQVFTLEMDSLKNEPYIDIGKFLEKKHDAYHSIDVNRSREDSILSDNDTNISRPPSVSEVCLDATNSPCEQLEHASDNFKESDLSVDSDISDSDKSWEPKKKSHRLNSTCKLKRKDSKYAEMRRKNNFASRRSRQTKKQKETEMEEKVVSLEKENELLRIKEKKLEELVDKLKQMLFSSVKKK